LSTVYSVGMEGDKFLMIFNPRRGGWEMPGGHIERDESVRDAAEREFMEETGLELHICACRPIRDSNVCVGTLGKQLHKGEMEYRLFTELPEPLAFPREEYLEVLGWAYSVMRPDNLYKY